MIIERRAGGGETVKKKKEDKWERLKKYIEDLENDLWKAVPKKNMAVDYLACFLLLANIHLKMMIWEREEKPKGSKK